MCQICYNIADCNNREYTDYILCPSCGPYSLPSLDQKYLESIQNIHLLAGYLFETQQDRIKSIELGGDDLLLTPDTINKIFTSSLIPKTSMQKLDKILLYMYNTGNGFRNYLTDHKLPPEAVGYAQNSEELRLMIDALCDLQYLKKDEVNSSRIHYFLTIHGLTYAESLLTTNTNSTKVFIAMKFSDDLLTIRDTAIKPACEACSFTASTVNEEEHNDDITDKIISEIKTSRFVIADFTYNNFGVYYEAGYAKGLGRTVIKTCRKDWFEETDANGQRKNRLHFDIEHDNLILWKDADDLRKLLEARIRATIL